MIVISSFVMEIYFEISSMNLFYRPSRIFYIYNRSILQFFNLKPESSLGFIFQCFNSILRKIENLNDFKSPVKLCWNSVTQHWSVKSVEFYIQFARFTDQCRQQSTVRAVLPDLGFNEFIKDTFTWLQLKFHILRYSNSYSNSN